MIKNDSDVPLTNDDLEKTYKWNINNGLDENLDKCFVMLFSKYDLAFTPKFPFRINDQPLKYVENIRDLRVIFDPLFNFKLNMNDI